MQFLGSRLPTFEKTFTVFQPIIRESQDAVRVLSSGFVSSPLIGYLEGSHPETFLSELDRNQFFAKFLSKALQSQEDDVKRQAVLVIGQWAQIGFIESYVQVPPILSSVVNSPKFRGACLKLLTVLSDYDECKPVIIKKNLDFTTATCRRR
jgi:hypothetical protein